MTRDRYLEIEGARLRYRDDGKGHAVMLVHGWTLDLDMWEPQVTDLTRRYRVIRFDRRGFGLSSGTPGIAADAGDVLTLCSHLGVERSVLVGMSQGARVLERLAAVAPALIRGLVFDGAPDMRHGGKLTSNDVPRAEYAAVIRTHGVEEFRRRWAAHPLTRLVTADQKMHELVGSMLARYQASDLRDAAGSVGAHAAARSAAGSASNAALEAGAVTAAAHFAPASLHLPTLILNGELDLDSRKQAGAALARLCPGAEHVIIPNAGHLPNLDNSATYNEILMRFLVRASAQ
jgi:3-oxoadipate enol-lactonase